MAVLINSITWAVAAERIKRRLYNGWPSIAENTTPNEIYLYLYEAIATVITQKSERGLAVEGIRAIPEGFITTYSFTNFTKDQIRGYYTVTLQQPPVGLPLGYSIISPYFATVGQVSYPLIAIHPFQRGYYDKLPSPNFGVYYFVENSTFFMDFKGQDTSIVGTLYIPMLSPRGATGQDTDVINIPDEAMSMVFDMVVQKLTQRLEVISDTINDGVDTTKE